MRAGQRLKRGNTEVCLFPLSYMYITQGEGGSYSHAGILAMDFAGLTNNFPYYAPVSCTCVATLPDNNDRIFTSIEPVYLPDGTTRTITWVQAHDNNPIANVGDTFTQGELIGHTGTYGQVTGDHVHFNFAYGQYQGWEYVGNNAQLIGSAHIYNVCFVNDTTLQQPLSYNWVTYTTPPTPTLFSKSNFKWVLYANKLRNRCIDKKRK